MVFSLIKAWLHLAYCAKEKRRIPVLGGSQNNKFLIPYVLVVFVGAHHGWSIDAKMT